MQAVADCYMLLWGCDLCRLQRSPSLKRLGYMMLASGVALALTRTGSTPSLERCDSRGQGPSPASPGTPVAAAGSRLSSRGGSGRKRRQHDRHHHIQQTQHGAGAGGGGERRRRRTREVASLAAIPE